VLPSVQLGLALLTIGLIRPWGEVFPRWLPALGRQRAPVAFCCRRRDDRGHPAAGVAVERRGHRPAWSSPKAPQLPPARMLGPGMGRPALVYAHVPVAPAAVGGELALPGGCTRDPWPVGLAARLTRLLVGRAEGDVTGARGRNRAADRARRGKLAERTTTAMSGSIDSRPLLGRWRGANR